MPTYRSNTSGYLNRYGLDFHTGSDTETYIIVPSDSDITVSSTNPLWSPMLDSGIVTLAAGATSDITIPFFTTITRFRLHVTSGNINVYMNDFTADPLRLASGDIIDIFWEKHYVNDVRFEGGSGGGTVVYNVMLHKPRDPYSWK